MDDAAPAWRGPLRHVGSGAAFHVVAGSDADTVLKLPRGLELAAAFADALAEPRSILSLGSRIIKRRQVLATADRSRRLLLRLSQRPSFRFEDVFPPTTVVSDIDVAFTIGGRQRCYRGWAIAQRRVACMDNSSRLDCFDWAEIAAIQHKLWSIGVGLGATSETWGPKNWALLADGHVRLFDVSRLTDDRALVAVQLTPEARRKRLNALTKRQPPDCGDLIEDYLSTMAKQLNAETLDRIWCSNL